MRYRIEKDELGEKIIPQEAYYGIGSLRSHDTFEITKHGLCRQNIKALANIKKAQAQTNYDFGLINKNVSEAICLASEEILNGRLHGQFITDSIQDGQGYGMEINAIEVIANRANEMLGGEKGIYDKVKKEEVSLYEDTTEVVTIAGKIAAIRLLKKLATENKKLINAYKKVVSDKGLEGTQIGNQLLNFSLILEKDTKQLDKCLVTLKDIDYGENLPKEIDKTKYLAKFTEYLNISAIEKFVPSKYGTGATHSLEGFLNVSSILKNMTVNLTKCALELKSMIINKELSVQKLQIIGGDNDEVIVLDVIKQISFYISGNDMTIARCIEAEEMGSCIYKPMIYACLFESCNLIRRTIRTVREKVIENIN